MTVIVEKPYRFVPPHRGNLWPALIQRLRLVDHYLARHDGVVDYECRHVDRLRHSLDSGHAVLLTPNHCRYADPLVLGWPAREIGVHVFAMASWHLFAKSRFDAFAIQKMGGFSIFREGTDRQSLETAIELLTDAVRPLILFPEGTTNRTNDVLQPLLDGVAFIARTAAKRRAKQHAGRVVVHPVAIKYLFMGDIQAWAHQALSRLEIGLGWRPLGEEPLLDRIRRLAEAMLAIHEVRYLGETTHQPLPQRRDALVTHLLNQTETEYGIAPDPNLSPLGRVRRLRSTLSAKLLTGDASTPREALYHAVDAIELAQQLYSYPDRYLFQFPTTDTQILETIERMQEGILGKPDYPGPLKAIIEFGEPIEVAADRPARGSVDPLISAIESALNTMLGRLALEANLFVPPSPILAAAPRLDAGIKMPDCAASSINGD